MDNNILVSIAIPAYKDRFLGEAIDSILHQTVQNFELIIVNDASPNPISEVVNKYKDPRIRYYINEQNIGGKDPVENWNKCLSYARGEYFALLCDDDIYEPQFIETMLQLAIKFPNCNVFKSGVKIVDFKKDIVGTYPVSPNWESCLDYIINVSQKKRRQTISEWMFRRDRMIECGGYQSVPIAWGADYLSIMAFGMDGGIAASNKNLVTFRRSGENISTVYDRYADLKLRGTKVYSEKLKMLLSNSNKDVSDELLNAIDLIKRTEQKAVMSRTSPSVLFSLLDNSKEYGLPKRMIIWAAVKNIVKKAIR